MYNDLLKYGLRIGDEHMISLGMVNHLHPLSITEHEFYFIKDYIAERKYKSGYEMATAFGVSSCAIGLGLKESNGKLISVDAYIEEHFNLAWGYSAAYKQLFHESDGYKTAKMLRNHFGLDDIIEYHVGWSPNDIPTILGDRKLDFVFVDAAHYDRNVLADVEVIKDRMVPPFTVMLHDTQAFSKETLDKIGSWLQADLVLVQLPRTWHLAYYFRS